MIIAIIAILCGIVFYQKQNKSMVQAKGEHARAMTYGVLTEEDEETNSDYVRFSAFFLRDLDLDGYAEKVKGTCRQTGQSDTLYFSLNVLTNGVLKNGKIQIEGNNMYFQTALVEDETIDGNYISNNTNEIGLKDVNVGTQKLIFGEVRSGNYNNAYDKTLAIGNDTSKYSAINKVILTGTHIADDGTETEIRKEVELPVDWYNIPNAEIPYKYAEEHDNIYQNYNNSDIVDEANNKIDLTFKIITQETKNLQNLAKSCITGEIPQLNGFDPINVVIKGRSVEYTYDNESRIFTAQRSARLDLEGRILTEAYSTTYKTNRYNEYTVIVTYPLEAYTTLGIDTINLAVPVKAWYEGYNNSNIEFDNPVKSNVDEEIISVTYEFGGGDVIGFDVKAGTYIPRPYHAWVISKDTAERMYKGEFASWEDYEDYYEVAWKVVRGGDATISNIRLREQTDNYTDKFLTTDNQYVEMSDFVDNVGIYFSGAGNMLGEDGYIDVYNDETDELIHRFTNAEWNNYNQNNPYYYDKLIKHIRIETSTAYNNSSMYIYNVKILNNKILTNKFTQEEFEKFKLIYSYMNASIKYSETEEYREVKNDLERANYDSLKSVVTLSNVDPTVYSTQEIKEFFSEMPMEVTESEMSTKGK